MDFSKEQSAGYLTNHLARLFARHLQERIKPIGLSTGVFPALLVLWDGDGLTQRELTEQLDIEQPTMANTLSRMERDGLIVRRRDSADARAQRIWLTGKARALYAPAVTAAAEVNSTALAALSPADREQFIAVLKIVIEQLQRPVSRGCHSQSKAG